MPLYVDGEIPGALTKAGSQFSETSVWWLFKKLGECVAEDFAGKTPRVQEVWTELETVFQEKAAGVEAEAEKLRSQGEPDGARSSLSRFMDESLDRVLTSLHQMLAEFGCDA
jgi:dipeptidase